MHICMHNPPIFSHNILTGGVRYENQRNNPLYKKTAQRAQGTHLSDMLSAALLGAFLPLGRGGCLLSAPVFRGNSAPVAFRHGQPDTACRIAHIHASALDSDRTSRLCRRFQALGDMLGIPENHTLFRNPHKPNRIPQKSRRSALDETVQPCRPYACRILRYIGIFHVSRHSRHKRNLQRCQPDSHDHCQHLRMALAENKLHGSPLSHGQNSAEKRPESRSALHKIHERQKAHHLPPCHGLYPACGECGGTAFRRDTLHDRFYAVYRHFQQRG